MNEYTAGRGDGGTIPATLIPGDGISPEIVDAVVKVLDALGSPFSRDVQQRGLAGVAAGGDPLPKATLDSVHRTKLALKGPLTTPVGGGFRTINVRLREEFQLYPNLRPAHTLLPGGCFENIDLVLVRENLEGLYVAFEHYIPIGDDPRLLLAASLMLDHVGRTDEAGPSARGDRRGAQHGQNPHRRPWRERLHG